MKTAIEVKLEARDTIAEYPWNLATPLPNIGDHVLVLNATGDIDLAKVRRIKEIADEAPKEAQEEEPKESILGLASKEDLLRAEENAKDAVKIKDIAIQEVLRHELDMHVVDACYSLDRKRIYISFSAEDRVDFRQLVRDLAQLLNCRIELRQIGVRDEAKKIGGYGVCGRPLCCHQFLTDFAPVSIKMAKEQSLSLNPAKISGCCGRLLCCLNYENEHYKETNLRLKEEAKAKEADEEKTEILVTELEPRQKEKPKHEGKRTFAKTFKAEKTDKGEKKRPRRPRRRKGKEDDSPR